MLLFHCAQETGLTLEEIGSIINRDHTSITHAKQTVQDMIDVQDALGLTTLRIIKMLQQTEL